jgi:hypothetical protein
MLYAGLQSSSPEKVSKPSSMICPLLDNLYPRTDVVGIFWLALVPVELLLKARLRFGIPPEGTCGNFEFSAAKGADSDCRSVPSHLTTQRRRWIMRTLSPVETLKLDRVRV